ncbi:hypothetical protein BJ742DRAFT_851659 [Cladochytrium replicatum]|nr:hypothetical protein BJ742DRAFT_851659 [Cladochytrium replicatum]
MHGHGSIPAWGFSSALDLQQELANGQTNELPETEHSPPEPISILLVACVDSRHILKTIAHGYRHQWKRPLHIHVIEVQATTISRSLLLLHQLTTNESELSIQERAKTFLELYGNLFLCEKTAKWVKDACPMVLKTVMGETDSGSMNWIDCSKMKFRDRDDVDSVLQFWKNDEVAFNASLFWEERLRRHYGLRYDSRENAIDWDFHMKLTDKAPILHKREFLHWRLNGIAYDVRDGSSCVIPNKSMATVDKLPSREGMGVLKYGYFSDVVVGPYLAFGKESENRELFKKMNDHFTKCAQDVALYNVTVLIHELHNGTGYEDLDASQCDNLKNVSENVKVFFHSPSLLQSSAAPTVKAFGNKFDLVYVGNSMAHTIPELSKLLATPKDGTSSVMCVETARFMIELNQEQIAEFDKRVVEMATYAGLNECGEKKEAGALDHLFFVKA